jgi:hypothetical protein
MTFRYFAKRDEKFMKKWKLEFREEIKRKAKEIEGKSFPLLKEAEESLKMARGEIEATQIQLENFVSESVLRKVVKIEIEETKSMPLVILIPSPVLTKYYGDLGEEEISSIERIWTIKAS